MNELATESTTSIRPSAPTGWCYISGRISVLETQFLNRSFFDGLLRSRSLSEARSALGKTQYRQLFTTDESLRDYAHALDIYGEELKADIMRDAPPHTLASFFEVKRRYTLFRTLFLRANARGAAAAELESTFDSLTENPSEAEALAVHKAQLKQREAPQHADAVARSLFLDSAACTLLLHLAEAAPELPVSTLLRAMAVLRTWTAVLRDCWNGTSAEVLQRWFIVPETYRGMIDACVLLAESNPADAISGFVPDTVCQRLKSAGSENLRRDIDMYVEEAIRDEVLMRRLVPYGPEKVLAYLVGYTVEQENLRLALASVVEGIDSGVVAGRLRRDYA